jgi:hypothetical protein
MASPLKFRGIPLRLIKVYLEDLGAVEESEGTLVAPTFRAVVRELEPHRVGSLSLPVVELTFTGDEQVLTELRRKAFRAGG